MLAFTLVLVVLTSGDPVPCPEAPYTVSIGAPSTYIFSPADILDPRDLMGRNLALLRGCDYIFQTTTSPNHPFVITSNSQWVSGANTAVSNGVVTGSGCNTNPCDVTYNIPVTFDICSNYYQCFIHPTSTLRGIINLYSKTCPPNVGECSCLNQCQSCDLSCGDLCQNTQSNVCGSDNCITCPDGFTRSSQSGNDGSSCVLAPTCSDQQKNGDETGVDCGGSCSLCPTCSDTVKNGDELGVDCGGSCSACTCSTSVLQFDGSVSASFNFNGPNLQDIDFSITQWVRWDSSNPRNGEGSGNYWFGAGAGSTPTPGVAETILLIGGYSDTSRISFGFWWDQDCIYQSANPLVDGWHHWAFTYDHTSQTRIIYLDGSNVLQCNTNDQLSDTGGLPPFSLGGVPQATDDQGARLIGALSDFRIYTRTLTADQVLGFMSGTLPAPDNLMISFHLDEGQGTIIKNDLDEGQSSFSDNSGITWVQDSVPHLCYTAETFLQCVNPPDALTDGTIGNCEANSNSGTVCQLQCNDDFSANGDLSVTCTNGQWSTPTGSCEVTMQNQPLRSCPAAVPTITVTAPDFAYHFTPTTFLDPKDPSQRNIILLRGCTYKFHTTNGGSHPFTITPSSDYNQGLEMTATGLTNGGCETQPCDENYTVPLVFSACNNYYQCKFHNVPALRGQVNLYSRTCPPDVTGCSCQNQCQQCPQGCGFCQNTQSSTCSLDNCITCPSGKHRSSLTGSDGSSCVPNPPPQGTQTVLSVSQNSIKFGQSNTYTATITISASATGNPVGGTVLFQQGNAVTMNTATVQQVGNQFQAILTYSSLPIGTNIPIIATYQQDDNWATSTSRPVSVTVGKDVPQVAITASLSKPEFTEPVTFTIKVNPLTPPTLPTKPTGTVKLLNGAAVLATALPLTNGVATFTTSTLAIGTASLSAVYSGDTKFISVTSAVLKLPVIQIVPAFETFTNTPLTKAQIKTTKIFSLTNIFTKTVSKSSTSYNTAVTYKIPISKSIPSISILATATITITITPVPTTPTLIYVSNWPQGTYSFNKAVSIFSKNAAVNTVVSKNGALWIVNVPKDSFSGILQLVANTNSVKIIGTPKVNTKKITFVVALPGGSHV